MVTVATGRCLIHGPWSLQLQLDVRLHLVVSRKRGVHRGLQAVVGCGRVGQPYDWYMHAVAQCCGLSPRHIGLRPCLHGLVAALEQRLAELEPHLAQREVLRRGEHQRDARRAHRVERRLPALRSSWISTRTCEISGELTGGRPRSAARFGRETGEVGRDRARSSEI